MAVTLGGRGVAGALRPHSCGRLDRDPEPAFLAGPRVTFRTPGRIPQPASRRPAQVGGRVGRRPIAQRRASALPATKTAGILLGGGERPSHGYARPPAGRVIRPGRPSDPWAAPPRSLPGDAP